MMEGSIKILIVDDMLTMRKFVIKALKNLGFKNFVEAPDGKVAYDTLCQHDDISLIISDWNMPNCTGIEFLSQVRSTDKYRKLPFVLLTAEAEKKQVAEAIQKGVSGYIVKPFTPEILKTKLEVISNRFGR